METEKLEPIARNIARQVAKALDEEQVRPPIQVKTILRLHKIILDTLLDNLHEMTDG